MKEIKKPTHKELVAISAKWLKKHKQNVFVPNCSLVVTELVTFIPEIADVIGWCSWISVLIEVKVSRQDFLKDAKKPFREYPSQGVGELRFYCCPKGLIKVDELPDDWGLLYYEDKKVSIVQKAVPQNANLARERRILLSIIRRNKQEAK